MEQCDTGMGIVTIRNYARLRRDCGGLAITHLAHLLQPDGMAADGQSAPDPVVNRAAAADRPGGLQTDHHQDCRTERKRAGGMGGRPAVA
jgi:hypothetical protein